MILLTGTKLKEIENKISKFMSSSDLNNLLFSKSKISSFKDMLNSYPDYIVELSKRYDKLVHPFIINGDDFLSLMKNIKVSLNP